MSALVFFFILISFRVCWNAVNAANAKCWIPCMTVYWCKCRLPALYLLRFFLSFFVSSFVCVSLCVSVRGILFLNESQKSFFFFGSPWVYGTFRGKFDRAFFLSSSIFAHRLSVPHYFIQFYLYTHTYMTHNLYELFERRKKNPTEERRKQKQAKKKQRREWAQWKPYKNRCLSRWNNKFQYNVYIILIFCVVCYFLLVLSHSHFVNKHIRIQLTAREQATKKECRNQKIAFTKKKKKWRKFFGLCVCAHTHTHTRWYANFMSLVNKKPLWAIHCITIAIFRRWFYSLW